MQVESHGIHIVRFLQTYTALDTHPHISDIDFQKLLESLY